MIDIERLHKVIEGDNRRQSGRTTANLLLILQSIVDGYNGSPSNYLVVVKQQNQTNYMYDRLVEVAQMIFKKEEDLRIDIFRNHRGAIVSNANTELGSMKVISAGQLDGRYRGLTFDGVFIDDVSLKLTETQDAELLHLSYSRK